MTDAAKPNDPMIDLATAALAQLEQARATKPQPAAVSAVSGGSAGQAGTAQPNLPVRTEQAPLPARIQPMVTSGAPPAAARSWSARSPLISGWIGVLVLVGGFGAWSVFSTLAGAVIAPGQLEVEQNRQVVQHPDGGVVEAILVKEGQLVAAGDPLIKLDGALIGSELSIVEGQFFELLARQGRLEAERDGRDTITFPPILVDAARTRPDIAGLLDGQQRLFEARAVTLKQQVEQLGQQRAQILAQVDGITAQHQALETQLRLIKEELVNQQSLLDKGLAEVSRVLALERESARLAGSVGELTASAAQAAGKTTEIDIEILKLQSGRSEDALTQLRDLGYRTLELAERRRALTEQVGRLEIRAPVSGIVYGLQVTTPRSVVKPADPLMFLVPQDRPLVITARIDPLSIDEVHIGQDVRLVFPTFKSRIAPELSGRITKISADAFSDQQRGISFYRAEIILNDGEEVKLEGTLIPGMPVQAFIRTTNHTPLEYLMQPFTDYFKHAFRES